MPQKKQLTQEQIHFVKVAYEYCRQRGLKVKQIKADIFSMHFNQVVSYSSLSKYVQNEVTDLVNEDQLVQISKIKRLL